MKEIDENNEQLNNIYMSCTTTIVRYSYIYSVWNKILLVCAQEDGIYDAA